MSISYSIYLSISQCVLSGHITLSLSIQWQFFYQIQIIFISNTCEHCVLMLPFARSYHTATTVGSTVYLTGGQINDYDDEGNVIRGVYTKTCLKWNFETDQWIYTGDSSPHLI